MEKIVVVSTNNNPDYFFFAPFIEKAWNKFGWTLAVMITQDVNPRDLKLNNPKTIIIQLPTIDGLRRETEAQGGRLYAANYLGMDDLIMTSDMDLIPLSNYWNPSPEDITIYGHDLTWRSFYPMGYIAMTGHNWKKYMNLSYSTERDFKRDADETKIAYSSDWNEWWNFDWDLITKRLKPFEKDLTMIDRGQINIAGATLAKGRVDRYNIEETLNQTEFIDFHAENNNVNHPEKLERFIGVYSKFH